MPSHFSILSSVGNTPLLDLRIDLKGYSYRILAKLEFMDPSGSIKDRIAKYIAEHAEANGALGPGYTVIEATSGNTGIALSMVAVSFVLIGHPGCSARVPNDMASLVALETGLRAGAPMRTKKRSQSSVGLVIRF